MKYMLLIYHDEKALSEAERQECYVESIQLAHQLRAKDQYLAVNPLHPTSMAISARVRDGNRLVTEARLRRRTSNWGLFPHRGQGSRRSHCRRRTDSHSAQGHRRGQAGDRSPGLAGPRSVKRISGEIGVDS
ncbi:MAG TPA: hypothetical protein VNK46_07665 [Nitrospiraceae bacterium]|jgi:hypothetical protein|nr:hypothetical protein [Nitrospiraceae bacterium]